MSARRQITLRKRTTPPAEAGTGTEPGAGAVVRKRGREATVALRPTGAVPDVTGIPFVDAALDRAVAIPSGAVHAHVERLRRRNPHASPEQIIRILEKQYLLAVSTSGGAVGAAAAVPAIGTGVGMALTTSEVATFFAASAGFALAVADVHGIGIEETERRRTLMLATVLGEQGSKLVGDEAGVGSKAWARTLLVNMPTTTIKRVNGALTKWLLKKQAAKQGALAFGRLAPFGIGAVVGASGARVMGKTVVEGARRAFGPPPAVFAQVIETAVTATDPTRPPVRQVTARGTGAEVAAEVPSPMDALAQADVPSQATGSPSEAGGAPPAWPTPH